MSNPAGVGRRIAVLAAGALAATGILALTAVSVAGPAGAAVPDRFGFVLWNGTAVDPTGTTPAGTAVSVGGVGQYKILFPGQAAPGGVVHVTAINSIPHWCEVNTLNAATPDEIVTISCFKPGGAPDYTAFSLIFSSSSGPASTSPGAFGYVDALPTGALVSQFNSFGVGNSVGHTGLGSWTVKFPGLSTPGPIDGSLQATAVVPPSSTALAIRCKVLNWSSSTTGQVAQVNCYNAAGGLADSEFMLTYQYQRSLYGAAFPPKYFGYLWNQPIGGPPSTNFNSVLGPGANSLSPGPLATVKFPSLAVLPDDIQVTAAGQGSEFCGLSNPWVHSGTDTIVRDVNCFDNSGSPVAPGFLISDNSAH
ncbi:MAG TPA: hypothetical protein VFU36_14670 [Jatrophihabitans sp.]|nr:hypothetical protein [Jatrophihabitans sp.]